MSNVNILSINQLSLFGFKNDFDFFVSLYNEKKLPNTMIISGAEGLGKSTFAYHFINFILSKNETYPYDAKNLTINELNKSYKLVKNNIHPNFFLVDILKGKKKIDINQIRKMISYTNTTSFNLNKKIVLIDHVEYLNTSSSNSLLKVIEEPNENTLFILIFNSNKKIKNTLKSRSIEFKKSLSYIDRINIFKKLLNYNSINFSENLINKNLNYYETPGLFIKHINLMNLLNLDINESLNIQKIIFELLKLKPKNLDLNKFELLKYYIEIDLYNKYLVSRNKNLIYSIYSNILKKINMFSFYNLDSNNLLYEIENLYLNAK